MTEHYYTGVGSRQTPTDVGVAMTCIAAALERGEWVLRSGGADGADAFFEAGVISDTMKEIYLPWKKFNKSTSQLFKSLPEATEIAKSIIPHWEHLNHAGRALHTRNVHQVLGQDLHTPSSLLVCWTNEAHELGGTATAIKLARKNHIPILNFGKFEDQSTANLLEQFSAFYEFSGDFEPVSLISS
jgi:hypothetical protein